MSEDPKADRRDSKKRKQRLGMQVSARSVKLLATLNTPKPPKKGK